MKNINAETYIENADKVSAKTVIIDGKTYFIPSNIPILTKGFIGRRVELSELLELKKNGVSAFLLWGMGGVGKTQLALKFIQEIEGEFDAHIKVDMKGLSKPLTALETMFEVVKAFEPEISANLSNQEIESKFSFFVNNKKTIILLDNAKDEFQYSTLNIQNAFVVITSRENLFVDGGETRKVDVLSEKDSQELLLSIVKKKRYLKSRGKELVNLVGRLPLAIKPLAVLLKRRLIDIDELIEEYKTERQALELKDPLREGLTIRAVFSLSEKFLDEDLKQFWFKMGVFPSDFNIEGAAHIAETDSKDSKKKLRRLTSKSLSELIELQLIENLSSEENERYKLHDLIRDYTRENIGKSQFNKLKFLFSEHYGNFLHKLNKPTLENLARFDLEKYNTEAGFKWLDEKGISDKSKAEVCLRYTSYANRVLFLRLDYHSYIKWLEKGLEAAKTIGNKRMQTARLANIGSAYLMLSDYKTAEEYYKKANKISEEMDDKSLISGGLNHLGSISYLNGEYRKAIEYYEKALKINFDYQYDSQRAGNLGNLGAVYGEIGNKNKALEYHKEALKIAEELDDLELINNFTGNIGQVYQRYGDYKKALKYLKKSLSLARQMKNKNKQVTDLINLGILYKNLEEFEKSENSYEKGLKIAQEIGDRKGENRLLGSLGVLYKNLDDFEKSLTYHKKALIIAKEIGDKKAQSDHLGNLGITNRNLKNYDKAINYYQKALNLTKELGDKIGQANWIGNIGNVYRELEKFSPALSKYEEALKISRDIGDKKGEGLWLGNLGELFLGKGDFQKATDFLNDAAEILEKIKSPLAKKYRQLLSDIKKQQSIQKSN